MAGPREPIEPLLLALIRGSVARIVELLDEAGLFELVERAVEGCRPQAGLPIREVLDGPGDAQAVEVGVGQGEQDQVDAILHALYQTV